MYLKISMVFFGKNKATQRSLQPLLFYKGFSILGNTSFAGLTVLVIATL